QGTLGPLHTYGDGLIATAAPRPLGLAGVASGCPASEGAHRAAHVDDLPVRSHDGAEGDQVVGGRVVVGTFEPETPDVPDRVVRAELAEQDALHTRPARRPV